MAVRNLATLVHSNPNIEIRNKSECSNFECSKRGIHDLPSLRAHGAAGRFEHLEFGLRMCFGFRASDFEFNFANCREIAIGHLDGGCPIFV